MEMLETWSLFSSPPAYLPSPDLLRQDEEIQKVSHLIVSGDSAAELVTTEPDHGSEREDLDPPIASISTTDQAQEKAAPTAPAKSGKTHLGDPDRKRVGVKRARKGSSKTAAMPRLMHRVEQDKEEDLNKYDSPCMLRYTSVQRSARRSPVSRAPEVARDL